MKACKVKQNMLKIYFLCLVSMGSQLASAESISQNIEFDNTPKNGTITNMLENKTENSQITYREFQQSQKQVKSHIRAVYRQTKCQETAKNKLQDGVNTVYEQESSTVFPYYPSYKSSNLHRNHQPITGFMTTADRQVNSASKANKFQMSNHAVQAEIAANNLHAYQAFNCTLDENLEYQATQIPNRLNNLQAGVLKLQRQNNTQKTQDSNYLYIHESSLKNLHIKTSQVLATQDYESLGYKAVAEQKEIHFPGKHEQKNNTSKIAVLAKQDSKQPLQIQNPVTVKDSSPLSTTQQNSDQLTSSPVLQFEPLLEPNEQAGLQIEQKQGLDTQEKSPKNRLLNPPQLAILGCAEQFCSPLNKFDKANQQNLTLNKLSLDLDPKNINTQAAASFLISGQSEYKNLRVELFQKRADKKNNLLASKLTDSQGNFYFIVNSNFVDNKTYEIFAKIQDHSSQTYKLQVDSALTIEQIAPTKFCGKLLSESNFMCALGQNPSLDFNLPESRYLELFYNSEVTAGVLEQQTSKQVTIAANQEYLKTLKNQSQHKVIYVVRDKLNPLMASNPVVIEFQSYLPVFNLMSVPIYTVVFLIILVLIFQKIYKNNPYQDEKELAKANLEI
ncbi:hypothetical protein HOH51_02710 [bacterium]|nr:hypothetical protein [bacterium]